MAHVDEEKNWEMHDVWIEDTTGSGSRGDLAAAGEGLAGIGCR